MTRTTPSCEPPLLMRASGRALRHAAGQSDGIGDRPGHLGSYNVANVDPPGEGSPPSIPRAGRAANGAAQRRPASVA